MLLTKPKHNHIFNFKEALTYPNIQAMIDSVLEFFQTDNTYIKQSQSLMYANFRTFLFGQYSVLEISEFSKEQLTHAINQWLVEVVAFSSIQKNLFGYNKELCNIYKEDIFFKITVDNCLKELIYHLFSKSLTQEIDPILEDALSEI